MQRNGFLVCAMVARNSQIEATREVVLKNVTQQEWAKLRKHCASDARIYGPGNEFGLEEYIEHAKQVMLPAFSQFEVEEREVFAAENDRVVLRWDATAIHDGPLEDIEPTGNQVSFSGITITRFRDGQIVEMRRIFDQLSILEDIDAL